MSTTPDRNPEESRSQLNSRLRWLLIPLTLFMLAPLFLEDAGSRRISYTEFRDLLRADELESVVLRGDTISARRRNAQPGQSVRIVTERVDPAFADEVEQYGVKVTGVPRTTFFGSLFSAAFPVLLLVGFWYFMMRRMSGGGGPGGVLGFAKSRAKVYVDNDGAIGFADVAGVDEAKAELEEVVSFLKDPEGYGSLGAKMPKGILLVGPPGTGKTLLARAVAGEAGVQFFSISGSEFVEMFVGVGAARVRDLFEQARAAAPCIVFVDELDALGKARSSQGGFGGNDEKEQTLNQLLVELDGFDPRSGIVLLAATNRPETLDPALLRAGRFDRRVIVDRPDRKGRAAILGVHLRDVKFGSEIDADKIAALTPGMSGADLANLVNEAALVATRRGAEAVETGDFTVAIERVIAGSEQRSRLMSDRERSIVANHEMGHALVAASIPETDPVHKVSIIPRSQGALGYTLQRPEEDRYLETRDELYARLAVLQGGRAAEFLVYGHYSTGASDDLQRATQIAREMVTRFAMVPELGSATYTDERNSFLGEIGGSSRMHSEQTATAIDAAIRAIVDASFARATAILEANRDTLANSVASLLDSETLDEDGLAPFFDALRELPPEAHAFPVITAAEAA